MVVHSNWPKKNQSPGWNPLRPHHATNCTVKKPSHSSETHTGFRVSVSEADCTISEVLCAIAGMSAQGTFKGQFSGGSHESVAGSHAVFRAR